MTFMKHYRIPACALFIIFLCCGSVLADDGVYNGGVIDHGLLGVADFSFAGGDLSAEPTEAGWVDNILQVTTWDGDDWAQCWGAYPWDTTGQWIVYTSDRENSNEICKMKADGTEFLQLTDNNSCDSHASFVPPNNDKIVFQRNSSGRNGGGAEIWIKDADDPTPASEINLTQQHGGLVPDPQTCNNKPVVSHDGTRIAFHTCYEDIWVMNIEGTDVPIQITDFYCCSGKHSWGTDDTWVLLATWDDDENGARIYRAEADGSGVTQLSDENYVVTLADESTFTADWKCENWPSLSPNGQWIAFHGKYEKEFYKDRNGYDEEVSTLSIMPSTGSDGDDVIHLVIQGLEDGDEWENVCGPNSWSPDSKWIAFKMRPYDDVSSIFAINIQTREIVQLTQDFDDRRMWWSPGGEKILFGDSWSGDPEATRDDELFGKDLLIINFKSCDPVGDVNNDGVVNATDLNIVLAYLNQEVPEDYPCADLNGDGTVTILDVRQMISENPLLARDRRLRRLLR
ncbi:MAG: PD40 domain-containing protein [Deltaproteobacteria bacterium]|nr:PD40 domain-containing protein [Deltaproteobacteria bacterium]